MKAPDDLPFLPLIGAMSRATGHVMEEVMAEHVKAHHRAQPVEPAAERISCPESEHLTRSDSDQVPSAAQEPAYGLYRAYGSRVYDLAEQVADAKLAAFAAPHGPLYHLVFTMTHALIREMITEHVTEAHAAHESFWYTPQSWETPMDKWRATQSAASDAAPPASLMEQIDATVEHALEEWAHDEHQQEGGAQTA